MTRGSPSSGACTTPARSSIRSPERPTPNIDARGAWDLERGHPDVIVAVIDTGADLDHPDLQPNILPRGTEDWTSATPATPCRTTRTATARTRARRGGRQRHGRHRRRARLPADAAARGPHDGHEPEPRGRDQLRRAAGRREPEPPLRRRKRL